MASAFVCYCCNDTALLQWIDPTIPGGFWFYLANMDQLSEFHPAVHEEFMSGNLSIRRSTQPFAQLWTDMALEQSIYIVSKTTVGIIGISERPGAQVRWFLTCHERAAITTVIPCCCTLMCEINNIIMRDVCALQDSDRVGTHTEATPRRMLRDDDDVRKLLTVITSGLMTDPFSLNKDDDEISPLVNIATCVRIRLFLPNVWSAPSRLALLGQITKFVEQRLNNNNTTFWDSLQNLKIKTFASLVKKKTMKLVYEKVLVINADRELFGRLVFAAKSRVIKLKDVLSYELSAVPFSFVHTDGSLRKTNKSVLMAELDKKVDVQLKLPQVTTSSIYIAHIFDDMALVHMTKSFGASIFDEMALKYYQLITVPLALNGCHLVDVVFDQYFSLSIKAGKREKRYVSMALEVQIRESASPVPKQ